MMIEELGYSYCLECGEVHDEPECPECGYDETDEEVTYTCDICGYEECDPWDVCNNCGAPAYPTTED